MAGEGKDGSGSALQPLRKHILIIIGLKKSKVKKIVSVTIM